MKLYHRNITIFFVWLVVSEGVSVSASVKNQVCATPAGSDSQEVAQTSTSLETSHLNLSEQLPEEEPASPEAEAANNEDCRKHDRSQMTTCTAPLLSDCGPEAACLCEPHPPSNLSQRSERSEPITGGDDESEECNRGVEMVQIESDVNNEINNIDRQQRDIRSDQEAHVCDSDDAHSLPGDALLSRSI